MSDVRSAACQSRGVTEHPVSPTRTLAVFGISTAVMLGVAVVASRSTTTAVATTTTTTSATTTAPLLPDMVVMRDGKPLQLAGPRARPTLLHLWATWCGPCREELPAILEYGRLGKVDVIALSVDDEWPSVQAYFGATIPPEVAWDPKIVVEPTMGVRSLPTTFVVDTDGRLRRTLVGAQDWRSPELRAGIDALAH